MKPEVEQLLKAFNELNRGFFDGFLDTPVLTWNSRLRSSAGRFIPGSRRFWRTAPAKIEVASYLLAEKEAVKHVRDTLAHEMIHYWLWVRRRPYGHTPEFFEKMRILGTTRYNPVPRLRPFRYVYRCLACEGEFPARRKLGPLACARCCKQHSNGKYDVRFRLELHRKLDQVEG